MGCWNGTCGITQLHIVHPQRMLVFPIIGRKGIWSPIPLPFWADYDDYGRGENCEGHEAAISWLSKNLVELEVGENEYHDIAVKREGFDDKVFFKACHKGRLEVGDNKISTMYINGDVATALLTEYENEIYVGGVEEYLKVTLPMLKEQLEGIADRILAHRETSDDTYSWKRFFPELEMLLPENPKRSDLWIIAMSFLRLDSEVLGYASYRQESAIRAEKTKENLLELLEKHLITGWINHFMYCTRKEWSPGAGRGSQQQDVEPYEFLIKATNNAIEKQKNRGDEE